MLDAASTASSASGPRSTRDRHDPRRDLLRDMAHLQATGESLDVAAQAEEHQLGDGHHRRQGSDLLTQRQFCALRRGRPGDHRVTITLGHLRSSSRLPDLPGVLLNGTPTATTSAFT